MLKTRENEFFFNIYDFTYLKLYKYSIIQKKRLLYAVFSFVFVFKRQANTL